MVNQLYWLTKMKIFRFKPVKMIYKGFRILLLQSLIFNLLIVSTSCHKHQDQVVMRVYPKDTTTVKPYTTAYLDSIFSFGYWNVSVPVSNGNGPTDLYPSSFSDFQNTVKSNASYQPYLAANADSAYIDFTCTYNGVKTSSNTSFCRTEAREFWHGVNATNHSTNDNWLLNGTHIMKVKLQVMRADQKVVIAQIHGKTLKGQSSDPPMLKVQWEPIDKTSGKISLDYKILSTGDGSLTSNWGDVKKYISDYKYTDGTSINKSLLNTDSFILTLKEQNGGLYFKFELNGEKSDFQQLTSYGDSWNNNWSNYFKTGNYFQYAVTDPSQKAVIRLRELTFIHQ